MAVSYDAIVIGGGLLGLSTAYHLVRGGARTLLLDRGDTGRATDAGAGILSPETSTRDGEAWFELAIAATAYYPDLLKGLTAHGAGDTGYARCGLLLVAASDDEIEPFEKARAQILARQQRRGLPSKSDLHELTPEQARALFPPLTQVRRALYNRHAARVDGRLLATALRQAATKLGLTIETAAVDRLVVNGARVTGVSVASRRTMSARSDSSLSAAGTP